MVGSNCLALKQFDGQIYAMFDCFRKWNGESKKFETLIAKDAFQRLELTVRDFTLDDRNSNIYLLVVSQTDSTSAGILTYVSSASDNPTMVSYAKLSNATSILTVSDEHLLVYGGSETEFSEPSEGAVYAYHIGRQLFHQELFLNKTFDTSKGTLFRLNNKVYSMTTTIDRTEKERYQVKVFPLKYDEEQFGTSARTDTSVCTVKAVCVFPRKAYHDMVYGSQFKARMIST